MTPQVLSDRPFPKSRPSAPRRHRPFLDQLSRSRCQTSTETRRPRRMVWSSQREWGMEMSITGSPKMALWKHGTSILGPKVDQMILTEHDFDIFWQVDQKSTNHIPIIYRSCISWRIFWSRLGVTGGVTPGGSSPRPTHLGARPCLAAAWPAPRRRSRSSYDAVTRWTVTVSVKKTWKKNIKQRVHFWGFRMILMIHFI